MYRRNNTKRYLSLLILLALLAITILLMPNQQHDAQSELQADAKIHAANDIPDRSVKTEQARLY